MAMLPLFAALGCIPLPLTAAVPEGGYSFVPSAKEAELYVRIRDDAAQQRVQVVLDPRLCTTARKQAEDTQKRKFFDHKNPDGLNSNQRVLNEGYPLPSNYTPSQNYVESMAGSVVNTPADAISLWKSDVPHANHIFGKTDFYRQQVVIGVGQADPVRWGYATYVFISAPPPVGQNWSIAGVPGTRIVIESSGTVVINNAQPESIIEVWKAGTGLQIWNLDHLAVVDSSSRLPLGLRASDHGFFRLRYFKP
jgi:hypothetical protein